MSSLFKQHEAKEKTEYAQRIRDIEHGSFTPLVFTTVGKMGREATAFSKRIALMISEHRSEQYSVVMGWIRCRLSFSLPRSALCAFVEADQDVVLTAVN